MKKLISMILCLCLMMSLVPGALAADGGTYLALGDDVTTGAGLAGGESGFPVILAGNNGYAMTNLAVDGNTTADLYTMLSGGSLDGQIASAELVTITGGGNELLNLMYSLVLEEYNANYDPDITAEEVMPILENSSDDRWINLLLCGLTVLQGDEEAGIPAFVNRSEFTKELETFITNLKASTEYILALNPDVTIIVTTQYNPYQEFTGIYETVNNSIDDAAVRLNRAISANSSSGGYVVADVYTAFHESSVDVCNASTSPLELDYLPNAAGHALIAETIQELLGGTEPEPTDPEPTEPQPTEPQPTEPQPTEPQPTEPEPTDPDHEHSFGQWVTVKEPTSEREGLARRFCVCGHYEDKVLPKLSNPFTDVKSSDYYYEPVLWAVNKGITSGVSSTRFGPNNSCTRGQIVTFLWAAEGRPEPKSTTNPFTDVKPSDYYYKAVLWAVENNITSGVSATRFGPNNTCTRGQVVTFLWAAKGRPEPETTKNSFSDVKSSDYYYKAVLWAVENEITSGVGSGKFGPNNTCTRGQIVTFLYKAFA